MSWVVFSSVRSPKHVSSLQTILYQNALDSKREVGLYYRYNITEMRFDMKAKKKQNVYIIVVFIIVFLLLVTATFFTGRIPMNPAGTIGNTAGNLNNGGLFCEYDGTVYFANAADNGRLYAMNPDETDVRKLSDLHVRNILAGGDFLYYFQLGDASGDSFGNIISVKSFNRCNLKGKDVTGLTRDTVITAQLVDNYLYLLTTDDDGPHFSKMKIDKSETVNLADYEINPACAVNGTIYYNGTDSNHYLYGLDTANDSSYEVWKGNIWYPIVDGDYVYYLDVANNYRLCRYSFSQDVIEVLTNDRVDCFNVGSGYVYYQKSGDTPQLKCMYLDGSNAMVIAEGVYNNINMTSQYVYFQEYDDELSLFHAYIGSAGYEVFAPVE